MMTTQLSNQDLTTVQAALRFYEKHLNQLESVHHLVYDERTRCAALLRCLKPGATVGVHDEVA